MLSPLSAGTLRRKHVAGKGQIGSMSDPSLHRKSSRVLAVLTLSFFLCLNSQIQAQKKAEPTPGPEALSVFPLAAQQGSVFDAQVRGKKLEGLYGVWFAGAGASARIERVESIELDIECAVKPCAVDLQTGEQRPVRGHLAFLKIEVDPTAKRGKHAFRLVTPRGVSNALEFVVDTQPVILETGNDNDQAAQAQKLKIPSLIAGRIEEMGDRDFYSFDVAAGQELMFHAVSNTTLNNYDSAQLTLYREAGSWFDSERPKHLVFSQDSRLNYTFDTSGRYFVAYTSFQGVGGGDVAYRLCVGHPDARHFSKYEEQIIPPSLLDKLQIPFQRKLESDRLQALQSRTVVEEPGGRGSGEGKSSSATGRVAVSEWPSGTDTLRLPAAYSVLAEQEPNETADQALEAPLPVLLEGAIERPADVDTFKLRIPAKAKLAFEIEGPEAVTPTFNPHVSVIDSNGEEMLNNYFRKIAGDGDDWVRMIRSKVLYTFEREGDYTLQIRDLTARYGEPAFKYRVLVRPQIPHVGKIEVREDVANLVPGEASKLTIITDQEEGFGGEVVFKIEGLPRGVEALAGADVEPDTAPPFPEVHKERFVPKSKETTIVLVTAADAPATEMPAVARIVARPVVGGKLGAPWKVKDLPVMVLKPSQQLDVGGD